MTIEVDKLKYWFYRLVAINGQTVMVSETYKTKWGARRAAKKIARANGFKYKEAEQ